MVKPVPGFFHLLGGHIGYRKAPSLEDIYTRFNIDHPKDFKGHSLSVSDIVVLHQNGEDAYRPRPLAGKW